MKIKHWLMVSFLVVMLLPVVAGLVFFQLIQAYDERQEFKEYVEMTGRLQEIELLLQEGDLYRVQPAEKFQAVQNAASSSLKITLYRADGITVYSSMADNLAPKLYRVKASILYEHLYELRKSHRAYTLKKPFFHQDDLIGFYEITIVRDQWLEAFQHRTLLVAIGWGLFFLLLYGAALYVIHRKLNRPMQRLMRQMTAFAKGEAVPDTVNMTKDEMGELIARFHSMRAQIERARQDIAEEQREREYMVASLSHDLKTPLTSLHAYAEALQQEEELSEEEKREYYAVLFDKIEHMKRMLDNLTMYTALKSSAQLEERVEVDGDEMFDMLFSGYEELCTQRGIRLTTECKVTGSYLMNAQQLIRLVDNLMSNAIRYTESKQSIWLGAYSPSHPLPSWIFPTLADEVQEWGGDSLLMLVQNQGETIAKDQLERIFAPFYQADSSRTKAHAGSSGLGLSIAKMIVEKHDGNVRIWSEAPFGTLVACRFQVNKEVPS
ncbi:sensor histidine kinase [Paenibacillus sp. OSY-SE]|uniref:sensor histidine kinase n=1 Tax=Paenibacillus sp. OSY-SE TaxID=1196323 RepID=UPI0002EBADDE|nr:HAMP domain-containing sensor histidine kinase [Paenibacillus sp. OSY-SE]